MIKHSGEFKQEAVRIALTSGLAPPAFNAPDNLDPAHATLLRQCQRTLVKEISSRRG